MRELLFVVESYLIFGNIPFVSDYLIRQGNLDRSAKKESKAEQEDTFGSLLVAEGVSSI